MISVANKSLFTRWPKALIALDGDNKIVQANIKACELLGWDEGELLGKQIHDSVCSHSHGFLHADNACPLVKSEFFIRDNYRECRWTLKSGDLRAVFAKGILLPPENTRLVVFSDKSDTNYSQKDMQRLASFAEHSPTPIIEFNAEATIEFTNPAMITLLSATGINENGIPEALPVNLKQLIATMQENSTPIKGVERTVASDEEKGTKDRTFAWDFHPIPAENGLLIQAFGRDITAEKQLSR